MNNVLKIGDLVEVGKITSIYDGFSSHRKIRIGIVYNIHHRWATSPTEENVYGVYHSGRTKYFVPDCLKLIQSM